MLNKEKLTELIKSVLTKNKFDQIETRTKLLLATCAVESDFGRYNYQIGSNVARGVFQMEEKTYNWVYDKYKDRYPLKDWNFIHDLEESILICSLLYKIYPESLPENTPDGIWYYYKKYFNSDLGATTREKFNKACEKHFIF